MTGASHPTVGYDLTRRGFLATTLATASTAPLSAMIAADAGGQATPQSAPSRIPDLKHTAPIVIASSNGPRACKRARELLVGGGDVVDAVVAGVNIVEDDPSDHSVGYGGLPNEDGVVELDASVMHGPMHTAGAVAAVQRIKNPSTLAALVMRRTDHVLLVGDGALRFARACGMPEQELLTDESRQIWEKWKATHPHSEGWLHPEADVEARNALRSGAASQPAKGERGGPRVSPEDVQRDGDGVEWTHGTITCMALTAGGDLGGCTSTSGLSYKLAGRVGDSPILGAGLFVDNAVGACGSTGRGEANLLNCSSFLAVELMRGGATPEEACLEALRRIVKRVEPRLREANGQPKFDLRFYAIRKDGLVGGAGLHGGQLAIEDADGGRLINLAALFT